MAVEKRVIVDQVECRRGNGRPLAVQVRMQKQLVDGDNVLADQPHRTVVEPGQSTAEQFALVNAHLASMGYPAVSAADEAWVAALVAVAHNS